MAKKTYSIGEAARLIGVSKRTLLYWFRTRGIKDVSRDSHGWRVFTEDDIERLKSFRKPERPQVGPAPVETFGAERRQWLRVGAKLPVSYEFRWDGLGSEVKGEAETINIGLGGAMLAVDVPVLRLGEIMLEITLPDVKAPIATLGEVRWARRWNGNSLVGVHFTGMGRTARRLIGDYVARIAAA